MYNSNLTEIDYCSEPKSFRSINELFSCYSVLSKNKTVIITLQLLLIVCTVLANLAVFLLKCKNKRSKNVFNLILIGHSIVDGVTGLVDEPLFQIYSLFEYWPMGETLCYFWNLYDSSINTVTNLHMLYMGWVRMRFIMAPNTFSGEVLIRNPIRVMLLIWIGSFLFWIPINLAIIGNLSINEYICEPYIRPRFIIVNFQFISWFFPILLIITLNVMTLLKIRDRHRKVSKMTVNNKKKKFQLKLSMQLKLSIFTTIYLIQWMPSCIIALIEPWCLCISSSQILDIYWLT